MYVLGIDGGGTKTKIALLNEFGELIGTGTCGPSSVDTVDISTTRKNIEEALKSVIDSQNLIDVRIDSVYAGIGGVSSKKLEIEVENVIREISYINKGAVVEVKNDVYNALAGGLATKCGIVIVIGTGAVSFGLDEEGTSWRCGGYHYKEGDAGSAFDLGFQVLKVLARALDGRYKNTPFTQEIKDVVNVYGFENAVKLYNEYYTNRTKTAQLAKLVTKYADLGDPYALKICEVATDELALLIKGVNDNLNLHNKEVAIVGSLGNADTIYKKMFINKVKAIIPNCNIHKFILDPVFGAGLMALKNKNIIITEKMVKELEVYN